MTEKRPAADLLTDVAYFVEDDNGNLQTVFDGEVIQAELVDEPDNYCRQHDIFDCPFAHSPEPQQDTRWLPKVPELNPRRRTPDEATPIFDELDQRRETKTRKSWTKTMHRVDTRLDRWKAQHRLEEGAHRDRVWGIEHASPLLNQLRQP